MGLLESVRNKLEAQVFNKLGSTATLVTYSSPTYDKWGDLQTASSASSDITIVPYNLFAQRISYQPFGTMEEGDSDNVVPYDTTINVKDKVTLLGTEYEVKAIEDYILQGGKLAIFVRLAKIQTGNG